MDELPPEARALLEQARTCGAPPDGARARVRRNVALAVTAAAGGSAANQTSAQQSPLWTSSGAKLGWLACAVVLGGGALLLLRQPTSVTPATRKPAPTQQLSVPEVSAPPVVSSGTTPLPEPTSMPLPTEPAGRARPRQDASGPTHLAAEMALLHEVSQALNQGELARAQKLLREHQTRFSRGQLRAEREGLGVLAQCMGHEARASEQARLYLRRAPDGVLAARIENACATRKQP